MHSIRRRLMYILVFCTIIAILLSACFVNLAVNDTFKKYISDNQEKRNERIIKYFEEIYKQDLGWTTDSGKELQHEGYMSNYCLTLLDQNKKEIWAMDPNEIKAMQTDGGQEGGEYKTNTFEIRYNKEVVGYVTIGQYQPLLVSEEDTNFINSINKSIAFSVLLTIIVSIFMSIYFSKQFSGPIKSVSETSVKLSEGNYNSKAEVKSSVLEINNLIKSINILGDKLKHQDDLRKRLVSDISHEIRTPLNIFQNNLEAMIDGVLPINQERLNNLNDEVIRFGKLLNNLDVLKEFEEDKSNFNFNKVDVKEILENLCNDFRLTTKDKDITIHFLAKQNVNYEIQGNRDDLRQVFINILSNAVKFNKFGGEIFVNLKQEKEHLQVVIQDTGIGIKKEDLPFIFERLYRGDKSRNEIEGTGIGLTIVKNILLLHSAAIEVESEEGKGTKFIITF